MVAFRRLFVTLLAELTEVYGIAHASRLVVALRPEAYTAGEVELLRLLGMDAGRELDWSDWPDQRELASIRKCRVTAPVSEKDYPTQTWSLEEYYERECV